MNSSKSSQSSKGRDMFVYRESIDGLMNDCRKAGFIILLNHHTDKIIARPFEVACKHPKLVKQIQYNVTAIKAWLRLLAV